MGKIEDYLLQGDRGEVQITLDDEAQVRKLIYKLADVCQI